MKIKLGVMALVVSGFIGLTAFSRAAVGAESATNRPAVLCLGGHGSHWPILKKLAEDEGFVFGAIDFGRLTWDTLRQFNAVIVFDMSRLNPDGKQDNSVEISPPGFQRVSDLLDRFVQEGGGLYIYGVSFTHMGQGWALETLDQFLKRFDAKVLFELLRDVPRESRQPDGQKVLYARADRIEPHPVTQGVSNLWYAAGQFSYGPWTRPLGLGQGWVPLMRTSEGFSSVPLEKPLEHSVPVSNGVSAVKGKTAVIYAARDTGKGRLVLNGGESTISFYGYAYSPFADKAWGRIGMEAGLNGIPSDGRKLLVNSLRWLVEPSMKSGALGGYVPPAPKPFEPRVMQPVPWAEPGPIGGGSRYMKGVFGVVPASGGGSGTVAEYAAAAKAMGLDYIVVAGDFAKMKATGWKPLLAECAAASTTNFAAIPAMITMDEQDNRFLQCGRQAWPKKARLSTNDATRVQEHLGYWMIDGNFPCRAPFWFSKGQYPAWLHSGYDTFAVRTYMDGDLVDDCLEGFLTNQEQGDRSRLIVVDLVTSPANLGRVREFTFLRAGDPQQVADSLIKGQFSGGAISYVSSGPVIRNWYLSNGTRNTAGEFYVPGTERWRLSLSVTSAVPLKAVTIYDSTNVFRRLAVTGTVCDVHVDGVHDMRHVLAAVVEDVNGGKAMTGALETQDALMYQYFCSDRCNIMSGQSTVRHEDGSEETLPATSMLYKSGRLYFGTVVRAEGLPGIDGSGGGSIFGPSARFSVLAEGDGGEERDGLHRILRPYESGDVIVFDTPILKRRAVPGGEIFGHAPYVSLAEPRVEARLVQYHFYRKPPYPAPMIADVSVTVTNAGGLQLKPGWMDMSVRFFQSWGTIRDYAVLRGDDTMQRGPAIDETIFPRWTADGLNGKPAVRFNGSAWMTTPQNLALPASHTLVAVARDDVGPYDNGMFLWFENDDGTPVTGDDVAGPAFGTGRRGQAFRIRNYPGMLDVPQAPSNAHVFAVVAEPGTVRGYVDGREVGVLSNGWTGAFSNGRALGRFVVGMHGGGGGQGLKGNLAEILVYNRALATAEVAKVSGVLAAKYGLKMSAESAGGGGSKGSALPAEGRILWLAADRVANLKSGDLIRAWADQSGLGHDAAQTNVVLKDTQWKGTLKPGDGILFPAIGEGFFVLGGDLGVVLQCDPAHGWYRLYAGRFDRPHVKAGQTLGARVMCLKMKEKGDAAVPAWERLRSIYGIVGKPAYSVQMEQGKVRSTRYLLELEAEAWGVRAAISRCELPQRLPIQVSGLNPKWTAAKVDMVRREWYPLGVWHGSALTSIDAKQGDHRLYIGNMVTADSPDVFVVLLPGNPGGKAQVEVHNPTGREIKTAVKVPLDTFVARAQKMDFVVPAMSSVRRAVE